MSPGRGTRGRKSAGLLLFRGAGEDLEVLLVHPGGPFWAKRDLGTWSIPKGECEDGEDPRAAAWREFAEELGSHPPSTPEGAVLALGEVRQKAGKTVVAWALAGDLDAEQISSNMFEMEWPPRSGRTQRFPEVDRAGWFGLAEARERINPAQVALLDRLSAALDG
jgi:predicted NUDIX family NTP pyrophosphohydrolase